jgi:hypothetical protein
MGVPGNANALLLASAAVSGGYQVSRSLRFNGSIDNSYLSRTPASAGNRTTWTWSGWVKRSALGGAYQNVLSAANSSSDRYEFYFTPSDELIAEIRIGGTGYIITTAPIYRDPSAWYHLLVVMDTTQATAANRHKIYINGTQVTNFSSASYPPQNATPQFNAADPHSIGRSQLSGQYFNGYLAECFFIDGQALDPSSFTTTDLTTGQLVPKAYGGSYGSNGFKLSFSDNSTTAALGTDTSGNGNTWTTNNFSVTAGSGNDSLTDTPTSYGTGNSGGDVRGNYCTANPLDTATTIALSNGNLDAAVASGSNSKNGRATFFPASGKWYWEMSVNALATGIWIGIATQAVALNSGAALDQTGGYSYGSNGNFYTGGTADSAPASYTTGDVIGCAWDVDAGTIQFYKNNSSQGTLSSITAGSYAPAFTVTSSTDSISLNFGQRAFAYTAPSGFKALVDTNLPAPVVAKGSSAMDVALFTGNGSSQNVTGLNFAPDFVWAKRRSAADSHLLFDALRGATVFMGSDTTNGDQTLSSGLTAFNSDGFSWGSYGSGATFVGWAWDAGSGSPVTNNAGSISSNVRANTAAGFSIVSYTGTGATGGTVGHGLGVTPGLIICKSRTNSGTNWLSWHNSFTNNEYVYLNSTVAKQSFSNVWGSSNPTSTVFGVFANATSDNNWGNMVAYCFAPVSGYSAMGSYVGNASADGPFVFCNFRPKLLLIKTSTTARDWVLYDTSRSTYNAATARLVPNSSGAEVTSASIDILSNGFKIRSGSGSGFEEINESGATLIYAAFAENPFQYARAR